MTKVVLTDTCFWLGLVDPRDQYHDVSDTIAKLIETYQIPFPWPSLYETISTHLTRRRERLLFLEEFIKRPEVILFDDTAYRADAIENVFLPNRVGYSSYSLADSVIRAMLKDRNVRINYLAAYNYKDFEDVCQQRQIEIV